MYLEQPSLSLFLLFFLLVCPCYDLPQLINSTSLSLSSASHSDTPSFPPLWHRWISSLGALPFFSVAASSSASFLFMNEQLTMIIFLTYNKTDKMSLCSLHREEKQMFTVQANTTVRFQIEQEAVPQGELLSR